MPQIIWVGQSGCLLPLLIIFNLFFGRAIFNSTYLWLGVEAALILIFIIKIHVYVKKINQQFRPEGRGLPSARQSHRPEGRGLPSARQSHRPKGRGLPSARQSHRPKGRGRVIDVEGKVVEGKDKLK